MSSAERLVMDIESYVLVVIGVDKWQMMLETSIQRDDIDFSIVDDISLRFANPLSPDRRYCIGVACLQATKPLLPRFSCSLARLPQHDQQAMSGRADYRKRRDAAPPLYFLKA